MLDFLYKGGGRASGAPRAPVDHKTKRGAEVGGQTFRESGRVIGRVGFRRRAAGAHDKRLELAARRRAEVLGLERRRQADAPQAVDDVLGVRQAAGLELRVDRAVAHDDLEGARRDHAGGDVVGHPAQPKANILFSLKPPYQAGVGAPKRRKTPSPPIISANVAICAMPAICWAKRPTGGGGYCSASMVVICGYASSRNSLSCR